MRVTIVKNRELKLTETFIRTHAEHLPAEVAIIHGTPPRIEGGSGVPFAYRIARGFARQLGKGGEDWVKSWIYAHLLKKTRADVVLAEYGTTGAMVWEACEHLGLPLVVHFHGYDASRAEVLEAYGSAYTEMFQRAAAVVAVSRSMRQRLIALGAPPDRVVLNPCSVELDAFTVGDPDQAPPTFLAVGRLVEKKAPHLLVLAFAEVHRRYPEARLCIIGGGHLLGITQDLVEVLGLQGAVDLLGPQPHNLVQAEMQRARAFVQHSVVAFDGDSEGTPVSVLEASASGLPVISTEHAGIPDAVRDGETGYIVAERDVEGMAARMLDLARSPRLARQLGRAGRTRMEALYGRELRMRRLREIVQRVHERRLLSPNLLQDPIENRELSYGPA